MDWGWLWHPGSYPRQRKTRGCRILLSCGIRLLTRRRRCCDRNLTTLWHPLIPFDHPTLYPRILCFALLIIIGCQSAPQEVIYQESAEDFPNPERGLYHPTNALASNFEPLSENVLKGYRSPTRKGKAEYDVVSWQGYRAGNELDVEAGNWAGSNPMLKDMLPKKTFRISQKFV